MILQSKTVPAGKVACLLCGGFISVSGGDRARFVDHMTNEHDAKTDCHQVLLAACVLAERERGFLVKATSRRLDSIGRNKPPNYSDSFLSQLSGDTAPAPNKVKSLPPKVPPPTSRRAEPVRQPRAAPKQSRVIPKQPNPRGAESSFLRGNRSISVSRVDQSRTCNMCQVRLASAGALIEHMNRHHFNLPGGINIMTKSQRSQAATAGPDPTHRRQTVSRKAELQPVRNSGNSRLGRLEVIKCPSCGKSVDKSKFAIHKLSHSHQRKPPPTKANVVKNKGISLQKVTNEAPITEKNEDIELVEIVDDTDEVSEELSPDAPLEESEDQAETETDKAVRSEIEKLDTTELLDNLVNFLQT